MLSQNFNSEQNLARGPAKLTSPRYIEINRAQPNLKIKYEIHPVRLMRLAIFMYWLAYTNELKPFAARRLSVFILSRVVADNATNQ